MAAILEQKFHTVYEIAKAWQVDPDTVRDAFQDEPGVLKLGRTVARGGKRSYVTLRIPDNVLERVYRQRSGL